MQKCEKLESACFCSRANGWKVQFQWFSMILLWFSLVKSINWFVQRHKLPHLSTRLKTSARVWGSKNPVAREPYYLHLWRFHLWHLHLWHSKGSTVNPVGREPNQLQIFSSQLDSWRSAPKPPSSQFCAFLSSFHSHFVVSHASVTAACRQVLRSECGRRSG